MNVKIGDILLVRNERYILDRYRHKICVVVGISNSGEYITIIINGVKMDVSLIDSIGREYFILL